MLKVLVLCTGNSCRSIMAEALFNHYGEGRIFAKSAGSNPAGYVHPKSIETIKSQDLKMGEYYSKSWDELEGEDFDVLVTVCDRADGEVCPVYLGNVLKTHWGVRDPAHFKGTEAEINQEFLEVFKTLEARVKTILKYEFENMPEPEFKNLLDAIGKS